MPTQRVVGSTCTVLAELKADRTQRGGHRGHRSDERQVYPRANRQAPIAHDQDRGGFDHDDEHEDLQHTEGREV